MFQYLVLYYRDNAPATRIYRVSVVAKDSDDARLKAAIRDPHYKITAESPRRGRMVTQ